MLVLLNLTLDENLLEECSEGVSNRITINPLLGKNLEVNFSEGLRNISEDKYQGMRGRAQEYQ